MLTTSANASKAAFKITDAKLYVPIVMLSIEDNGKLSKLLGEEFKGSIYWNKYKVIDNRVVEIADYWNKYKVIDNRVVEIADNNEEKYISEFLDSSYQGVKRLFAPAYDIAYNGPV